MESPGTANSAALSEITYREYNTVQSSKFKCIVHEWDLILWNLLLLLINFIIWCDINLFREIQENLGPNEYKFISTGNIVLIAFKSFIT